MKTHQQEKDGKTPFAKDKAPEGNETPQAAQTETETKPITEDEVINFAEDAGDGLSGHKMSDYKVPFITIVQKLSPQMVETDAKYNETARDGMVVNTVSGKIFEARASKNGGITVIAVNRVTEYLEWAPNRGGLVAVHLNESILAQTKKGTGNDDKKDFLPNGNQIATTSKWFCLFKEDEDKYIPVVISMASSNLKHSRNWLTLISNERIDNPKGGPALQPAMYYRHWNLTTVPEVKDKNTYYAWTASPGEVVKKKAVYAEAKGLRVAVVEGQLALPSGDGEQVMLEGKPVNY